MTEDIIKSITNAEAQAAEWKREAEEKATAILSEAELRAARTEKTSEEVCKAYRETQTRNAYADAEKEYAVALKQAQTEAKAYCDRVMESSESVVSQIVGRIIGGSC